MSGSELEVLVAEALGCEEATAAVSGCAAMLAVTSCATRAGRAVLLPGWICSGVVHAVLLAGMRPVLVDVDDAFLMSTTHADRVAASTEVGMVLYAPYGGFAPDLARWRHWADLHDVPLVVDLAQVPDPEIWHQATAQATALVSSFRPGKPLGAAGGGIVAGGAEIVEECRRFLNGGKDDLGRKVAIGMDLRLAAPAARSAMSAVTAQGSRVPAWRHATRLALSGAAVFPGWQNADVALSRIPRVDGAGRRLHPDAMFGDRAWRAAVTDRLGAWSGPPLRNLEALYERVTVTKIHPDRTGDAVAITVCEDIPA